MNHLGLCCLYASTSERSSAAGPCGCTAHVISVHPNTKWPPGKFSFWSSSWFACFLPARILCGCTFPSGCVSPCSSSFDCQTRRRSLFSPPRASSRIQSLPGAQGSALPTHAHSLLLFWSRTPPPTLSCSRRCLHPPSSGCASARPALLSRRPDGKRGALCAGTGAFSQIWCGDASLSSETHVHGVIYWHCSFAAWNRCPAFGRVHSEWSVRGTAGSSWMDEWMLGSRISSEMLKRWRGWRTGAMGLPTLCLSSWWPVAGWGRIHHKQEQHQANWEDVNDPKIISLPSRIKRGNLFPSCSRQNHSAARSYFGKAKINLFQFTVKV